MTNELWSFVLHFLFLAVVGGRHSSVVSKYLHSLRPLRSLRFNFHRCLVVVRRSSFVVRRSSFVLLVAPSLLLDMRQPDGRAARRLWKQARV